MTKYEYFDGQVDHSKIQATEKQDEFNPSRARPRYRQEDHVRGNLFDSGVETRTPGRDKEDVSGRRWNQMQQGTQINDRL